MYNLQNPEGNNNQLDKYVQQKLQLDSSIPMDNFWKHSCLFEMDNMLQQDMYYLRIIELLVQGNNSQRDKLLGKNLQWDNRNLQDKEKQLHILIHMDSNNLQDMNSCCKQVFQLDNNYLGSIQMVQMFLQCNNIQQDMNLQ